MNKKGFTLIELLAVIVILAIIALIATPIVLNIINDAKEQSGLRSADFYLDALELSIAQSVLDNKDVKDGVYTIKEGNICLDNNCTDILPVEVKGEVPSVGSIYIKNGQIDDVSLVLNNNTIGKKDGELVYINNFEDVCTIANDSTQTGLNAGAKYNCKVKAGTSYTFYVLTTPSSDDTHVNLIMDQNINSDGTPAGITGVTQATNPNQYNLVAWNDETGQGENIYGPVTAIKFLHDATKTWTNIEPLNYTYNDIEFNGITEENIGYTSFISNNGVATITGHDTSIKTSIGTVEEPLRVRMPIYTINPINVPKNEVSDKTEANAYLYKNLSSDGITVPYGYYTLSSETLGGVSNSVWNVLFAGVLDPHGYVPGGDQFGVRPVIS